MSHDAHARPLVRAIDVAGRAPPSNTEAEAAVLSACLASSNAMDVSAELLTPAHFYVDANRRIFEAAIDLHSRGQPVDVQTVGAWLRDRERLQAIGGAAYLAQIIDATPAIAHVAAHAKIVREKARLRSVIEVAQMIAGEGYSEVDDLDDFCARAESSIAEAAQGTPAASIVAAPVLMADAVTQIERASQCGGVTGTPTGFVDLDTKTSGLHEGEQVIIAARTSVGKTSFALDVATRVAAHVPAEGPRSRALLFSLEMPRDQIAARMLASDAQVNLLDLRAGRISGDRWTRMLGAADRLASLALDVDDSPALSVMDVQARIRACKRAHRDQRLAVVIIDYLQLMRPLRRGQSREIEVAEISRGLKAIAKREKVTMLALAQLSRACEQRSGKDRRPMLSDLRESGAIENDADVVLFLYRPEMYLEPNSADWRKVHGYAECIIAKQRNGPTGRVPLTFVHEYARFENRARECWREEEI